MDQEQLKEANRLKRLANLKPFSSEYQPKNRRSRKGIPNSSTVLKYMMKELDRQEKRRARKAGK